MVWNTIKDVFASPDEQSTLAGARAGKAILTGILEADDEQLQSPIQGHRCLAFYYRATWMAKTRDSETQRVYREAECYAPGFWLKLDDASLWVVPKQTEPFTQEEHQEIKGAGIPGLLPAEQLVREGDRVRLHGRLRQGDEQPWFELARIDILESRPMEQSAGNRKARRKQQRDQRRERKKRS
jgi:hypothetical protein